MRVSVVKSSKVIDAGEEVWSLLQDEIPERKPDPRGEAAVAREFQRHRWTTRYLSEGEPP